MPDVLDCFKELRAFQGCSVMFREVSGGLETFLGFCGVAGGFEGFLELFMVFSGYQGSCWPFKEVPRGFQKHFELDILIGFRASVS